MNFLTILSVSCKIKGRTAPLVIPDEITSVTSLLYHVILIGVPVLLILFGMWDLGKAVMAQKEDEIKKGQQTFIKRLIAAVIVFLVYVIVNLVIGLVLPQGDGTMNCVRGILGI